jgi:TrmH family RNA methyltransferase
MPTLSPAARLYSRARRNLLPRDERLVAVAGRWQHDHLRSLGIRPEVTLRCGQIPYAPAYEISPKILARLHPGLSAPALLSVVRLPHWTPADVLRPDARLLLVADGIEYAGNLGTLVRTADACAADALVLTRATARVTHPKAFGASRGMVLTTPVLTYASIASARADLAAAGFTTYVADPAGATPYRSAGLGSGRTAVVVGSEGDGVSDEWRRGLTRVAIPMLGQADSLNVAVSAAVLLFEARSALDGR